MLPNIILAGTNKAGTTSLFRYLSDHPDVASSKIKEVRFFSTHKGDLSDDDIELYHSYFPKKTTKKIVLEASPCYLAGGEEVAININKHVPDVKLIFLLRDPVGRLISNYRRRKERQDKLLEGVEVADFINLLLDRQNVEGVDNGRKAVFQSELSSVCYGDLLKPYYEIFGSERIYVCFFDDLCADTKSFMQGITNFLGIDPQFYDNYTFNIENKTRTYRFKKLQKIVFKLNMFAEPVLNRAPKIKNKIRNIYNLLNEKKAAPAVIDKQLEYELLQYFNPKNKALKQLLEDYNACNQFPGWLEIKTENK